MRMLIFWCFVLLAASAFPTHAQQVSYIHTDALGSVVLETDANRQIIGTRSEYEPYGRLLAGSINNEPGYTGHVMDAATGLTYMQQRYYDPMLGRFLSVDPVTPLSNPVEMFNRYKYAANNPYSFTDPDGRQESSVTRAMDRDNRAYLRGEMSPEEVMARRRARFRGGVAGGAVLLGALAPDPTDIIIGATFGRLALGLNASKSVLHARRYIESLTDGFERTGGRSSRRTLQANGVGGARGAGKLFDKLTRGSSKRIDGGGRIGSLGDGSTVQINSRALKSGVKVTNVRIISSRVGSNIKDTTKARFQEK